MATRILCTPFGKRMKIAVVRQNIPQQELARRLGPANSTVDDVICSRNRYERAKKKIAGTPRVEA